MTNWAITSDPIYKKAQYWDGVWSGQSKKYASQHKYIWEKVKEVSSGNILDLACGDASCWNDYRGGHISGCDFSPRAISEAKRNISYGDFVVEKVPTHYYDGRNFDTVVISGLVNYYEDLEQLKEMLNRIDYQKIVMTINKLDDFPNRYWNEETIHSQFSKLGVVSAEYDNRMGWLVIINK